MVFIYDPNLLVSNQQATELISARNMLSESVVLLIAKTGASSSKDFRNRYNTQATELLFFDVTGNLASRSSAIMSTQELIEILAN